MNIYRDFSAFQNMLTIVILIISFYLLFIMTVKNKKDLNTVSLIFIWHTIYSILYYTLSVRPGAVFDAKKYYRISISDAELGLIPGTKFIYAFTSTFSRNLNFSYLNSTLVYNSIGAMGLVLLYLALKKHLRYLSVYWTSILFLPSLSYWSSGLGKDSISFFSTCLFIYSITSSKYRNILFLISLSTMFMVRPHIAFAMLISFVAYFIIQSNVHILLKLMTLPIIGAIVLASLGYVQEYTGLEDASIEGVTDYYDSRSDLNMDGGSSINTSNMPLLIKMFSYIFRPFPFEAHSLIAFIASIENSILFLTFIYITYKARRYFNLIVKSENLWLLLYTIITWIMLSYGLKNLGIAARQKWMFMPVIIYLLLNIYSNYKRERLYKNS